MGLQRMADCPCSAEKGMLISMVYETSFNESERENILRQIDACDNYAHYQQLFYSLEHAQKSIHEIINPNGKDVIKHLRKFIK
jgi:hypothetical protein